MAEYTGDLLQVRAVELELETFDFWQTISRIPYIRSIYPSLKSATIKVKSFFRFHMPLRIIFFDIKKCNIQGKIIFRFRIPLRIIFFRPWVLYNQNIDLDSLMSITIQIMRHLPMKFNTNHHTDFEIDIFCIHHKPWMY